MQVMAQWKKYLIGEWNWKRPFKSIAFIYLCLLIVSLCFRNRLIYQPPVAGYHANTPNIITTKNSENQLIGMSYFPAAVGMPTLLWSHGNAEDIGYLHQRFESFHARGYGILAYDYPGYGISDGSPTEQGCYNTAAVAWTHLTSTLQVKPDQILIYGQSVGSGPACWLAERESCAGLVLVSPLTSAFRAVTRIPIFPGDQYPNIKRIREIQTPLLVIHGNQDRVVSQWNGKKLYELHSGPKQFFDVTDAGHNDLYLIAEDEILNALDAFWKNFTMREPLEPHTKKVQHYGSVNLTLKLRQPLQFKIGWINPFVI